MLRRSSCFSSQLIKSLVNQYCLNLGGKKVWCPYWVDIPEKGIRGWHGGKGTPQEITQTAMQLAQDQKVDLQKLSPTQIRHFITRNRLGIDCSGFVYFIIDQSLQKLLHASLDRFIKAKLTKHPLNPPRFRCNADCLTNERNAISVNYPKEEIQPGDLIRVHQGKHVAVISQITKSKIIYAHSSKKTVTTGVHFGQIAITHPKKSLAHQEWRELSPTGQNYASAYFRPQKGDGIKRLKYWCK